MLRAFATLGTWKAGRRGQVNAVFGLTRLAPPFAGRVELILWTIRFGRSNGSHIMQAAPAALARSSVDDQGYTPILQGCLSATRGAVSGGVRDHRERR